MNLSSNHIMRFFASIKFFITIYLFIYFSLFYIHILTDSVHMSINCTVLKGVKRPLMGTELISIILY